MATTKKTAVKTASKGKNTKPAAKAVSPVKKTMPIKKATPTPKTATKKAVAKKAQPAKKAVKSSVPVQKKTGKATPAKVVVKAVFKKAIAAPKKAAPVKKAPIAKTPVKKATPAKKTVAAKKTTPVKKTPVAKTPVKKAAPAKKTVAAKKATPVKKTPVAKTPVKKATPAKKQPVVVKKATPAPIAKKEAVKKTVKPQPVELKKVVSAPRPAPVPKPAPVARPSLNEDKKKVIVVHRRLAKDTSVSAEIIVAYQPGETRSILDAPEPKQAQAFRYSDEELQEFKDLVQTRLESARRELLYLQGLITRKDEASTEDTENRYTSVEDGSGAMEREQLALLASRQIQFINNLEKAMVRIENKTYGVCRVTGKLIDKARLRAVPHATLSMEAKKKQ
jgi:RNA polymerase-binding transcription factor DksA